MYLKRKLFIGAVILIAVSLLITGILSTVLINRQFNQYLLSEHNKVMRKIKDDMTTVLNGESNISIQDIELYAVSENHILELSDASGQILFISQNFVSGGMMGRNLTLSQMQNMPMYSAFEVDSTVLKDSGGNQYLLNIAFDGDLGKAEEAAEFKKMLYVSISASMIISIAIGSVLSVYYSKPISDSIHKVTNTAKYLTEGKKPLDPIKEAGIVEIDSLNDSMIKLASTLEQQESMRKSLVEMLSHEVKTPLTVLKSHIDAFTDGIFKPDKSRLSKCKDEIVRIESLMERIDELQDLSKNGYVLNLTEFDLEDEISSVCQILEPQFSKKSIKIEYEVNAGAMVELDRYKLRQIIYNLMSNAFKFSDEGSIVRLAAEVQGAELNVRIENKGLVIDDKDYNRVFNVHYRAENANKYDTHGKGLGLKISKNLANFMGGDLVLVSSDKEATVFQLALPIEISDKRI